jgi:HEAT repeat protein
VLAIRGLAALDEKMSLPRLLELAEDRRAPVDVRLEAAAALGLMQTSGLLESALRLSEDKSAVAVVDRLVASRMLASHQGDDSERLLIELATDEQPSVRAIALSHLFRSDPGLILPIIEETVGSKDANVRRWGAETLVAEATPETLAWLGPMLDDHDPEIRRYVCDSLVELSKDPALQEAVHAQGHRMLHREGWRGQEQAALLLVTLGDTSIVMRLLDLLDANRPEVHVAAAWGLCELAVPETAPPILEKLESKTEACLAGKAQVGGIGDQLALLVQALCVMDFRNETFEEVLRKYIPKDTGLSSSSRAAAIWTLGHFYAEQPDEQLVRQFRGRLLDAFSEEPESFQVARMSAVSLGRMNAVKTLPDLRFARGEAGSGLGYACDWAIWQLTGEEIPPLTPTYDWETHRFLTPASHQ